MAVLENQPGGIEFRITRDPRSRAIYHGGGKIGSLQQDEDNSFKVVLGPDYDPPNTLDMTILEAVRREIDSIKKEHFDPYGLLRRTTRDLLFELTGEPGHPGSTDRSLLDAVRGEVHLPPSEPWSEWGPNPFQDFRARLIETIQQAGVEIKKPTTEVRHITEAIVTVLFRELV